MISKLNIILIRADIILLGKHCLPRCRQQPIPGKIDSERSTDKEKNSE